MTRAPSGLWLLVWGAVAALLAFAIIATLAGCGPAHDPAGYPARAAAEQRGCDLASGKVPVPGIDLVADLVCREAAVRFGAMRADAGAGAK